MGREERERGEGGRRQRKSVNHTLLTCKTYTALSLATKPNTYLPGLTWSSVAMGERGEKVNFPTEISREPISVGL